MGGSVVAEAHCAVVPVVVAVRNLWPVHAAKGARETVPNDYRSRADGGSEAEPNERFGSGPISRSSVPPATIS